MAFVACGVMLQNDKGDLLKAFSNKLGHCTILNDVIWVILFCMNMACDLSYKTIIVEKDCAKAIKLVQDLIYHEGQFVDLTYEIVKTKEKFTSYSIIHVLHDQTNNTTNYFAKNDLTIDRDVCFYI